MDANRADASAAGTPRERGQRPGVRPAEARTARPAQRGVQAGLPLGSHRGAGVWNTAAGGRSRAVISVLFFLNLFQKRFNIFFGPVSSEVSQ